MQKFLKIRFINQNVKVETDYKNLLANQEIYGEVWLQDIERELDKLISKSKQERLKENQSRMSQPTFTKW